MAYIVRNTWKNCCSWWKFLWFSTSDSGGKFRGIFDVFNNFTAINRNAYSWHPVSGISYVYVICKITNTISLI